MDIKQVSFPESRQALPTPQPLPTSAPHWRASQVDVLRSLRIHALAATLVALLTLGLGLALLIQHHPTYAATSVVYVSPVFPATLSSDNEHAYPYESYVEEQVHSVTRYDVLADAIRQLKPGVWGHPGMSEEAAVNSLQRQLSVKRVGLTYQVQIMMTGSNPEHLAEIVNAVTNSYLKKTKSDEFYGQDVRLDALKQARDNVQKELNTALGEQAKLSQQLGVAVLGSADSDQLDSQVAKLRSDLTAAHEQRIEAEAQLSSLQGAKPGVPSPALDEAANELIASDPGLMAMKASLSQRRAALLNQLAGLTPNHPLRKQTELELAEIEGGLQQMQNNLRTKAAAQLQQKLRTELRRATTVEAKLNSTLQATTGRATSAAPKFQRADELKDQITALQARYTQLDERARNLELDSTSPGSVHLFSPARMPLGPEPSKLRKMGVFLLPFALLMGIASAVLIDYFDPRVYSPSDIEAVLGFSPIGAIFDDREVTMHAFDECTLRMAAGIDQAARNVGVRTIVLTGVHSGAGTTSIVENLGSTLAKLGRKTLTIDASGTTAPVAYLTIGLNRPAQKPEGGFSREAPHTDLQTSGVVAQSLPPQLAPLTSFMDQAFKDLTKEYELVLIDATPLLISAETEYMARFADVSILIAESGKTRKADLRRAALLLERLNVRGLAAVINKVGLLRASQATKKDLEDFEAHVNRMNLRWRPGVQPTPSAGSPGFEDSQPSAAPAAAAKENATYA